MELRILSINFEIIVYKTIFIMLLNNKNKKNMSKQTVINLIANRDGISFGEAKELVNETIDLIIDGDIMEADQILADQLGLEPDYLFDLLPI